MHPQLFKEELNSGFYCDILLAGLHNDHLREFVDDHDDPDLNRNTKNYRYNHKYRDATEIILHFINVKY